jgi:hypothetical protein
MVMMIKIENLNFETWCVALANLSSVIFKKNTFLKRQLYYLVNNKKMCSLFSKQHGISYLFSTDIIFVLS